MADISKCNGTDCKLKEICYRYTCEGDIYWQSYLIPNATGEACDCFWPDEDYEAKKEQNEHV